MVRYIFASHYRMADGLKETIEFLTSVKKNVYAVSAYVTENYNIEEEIKKIFDNFTEEDKVVVMTDMLAGSVNQKFIPYMSGKCILDYRYQCTSFANGNCVIAGGVHKQRRNIKLC